MSTELTGPEPPPDRAPEPPPDRAAVERFIAAGEAAAADECPSRISELWCAAVAAYPHVKALASRLRWAEAEVDRRGAALAEAEAGRDEWRALTLEVARRDPDAVALPPRPTGRHAPGGIDPGAIERAAQLLHDRSSYAIEYCNRLVADIVRDYLGLAPAPGDAREKGDDPRE